jgi:hypothetical protein
MNLSRFIYCNIAQINQTNSSTLLPHIENSDTKQNIMDGQLKLTYHKQKICLTVEGIISIVKHYNCLFLYREEILFLSLTCDQSIQNQLLNYNGYIQFIDTYLI